MAQRRVIIAHGWNDGGNNQWINWLVSELERRRYQVVQPIFPHVHVPRPADWVQTLRTAAGELDDQTVLVGYSLGVPTVLRFLNDYPEPVQIAGLILVAGFGDGLGGRPAALFAPPLDYKLLQSRAAHRVCIYSDNDYLISPKLSQRLAADLKAREVIVIGGGHLIGLPVVPGSVDRLPSVLEAIQASYRLRIRYTWRRGIASVRRWLSKLR